MSLHGSCLLCGVKIMGCRGFCSEYCAITWYTERKKEKK